MRRTISFAVSVSCLAVLALAGCRDNQGSIAHTNASANAQLEVINQQTPESAQTMAVGQPVGKQPSNP